MSKIDDKLAKFRAYHEAVTNLLKIKLKDLSFKEIDYFNDLNERIIVAINFLEKLDEINKNLIKIEKETMNYGKDRDIHSREHGWKLWVQHGSTAQAQWWPRKKG